MKNKSKGQFAEPANPPGNPPASNPVDRHRFLEQVAGALAISLLCSGVAAAQDNSPIELRRFIDRQVGGIGKLMVPALDSDLPQPLLPNGTPDPRFRTTEAKRYLGKLLFFDPVRTARILPEYGGVLSTRQTGSCGACHLGEVASRTGEIINLNVGGEGRGFTDASGRFIARRRIKPGLVDAVPTLTEICVNSASINCAAPSHGLTPATDLDRLVLSGRADAVDSVPRNTPGLIGFAFNNRLLLGGLTGDPAPFPIGVNPSGLPAGENLAEATNSVHRMFQLQSAVLQRIPALPEALQGGFPCGDRHGLGQERHERPPQRRNHFSGDGHLHANRGHTKHALGPIPGWGQRRPDGRAAAGSKAFLYARELHARRR